MKILANDGISESGIEILESNGFEVISTKVAQSQLENYINNNNIDVLLVRSNTQVRQELIEACPSIKLIGLGGVDIDNIDVDFAIDNGVQVINTPAAASNSVAELVFAHLLGMNRYLHYSNREMPLEGDLRFKELKKEFSKGNEVRGKKLGIIGFGRIGKEVAKLAIGMGMEVLAFDPNTEGETITLEFFNKQNISFHVETLNLETVLKESDFITIHVPAQDDYTLGENEISLMKKGVGIVNTARGGSIDEVSLVNAIKSKQIKFAGLDVFENEPYPEIQLLMNPDISLTPHIGASTIEARDRIGVELATKVVEILQ